MEKLPQRRGVLDVPRSGRPVPTSLIDPAYGLGGPSGAGATSSSLTTSPLGIPNAVFAAGFGNSSFAGAAVESSCAVTGVIQRNSVRNNPNAVPNSFLMESISPPAVPLSSLSLGNDNHISGLKNRILALPL